MSIEDKHLTDAIDRIARSADGHFLYLFLQRHLMSIPASTDQGALLKHDGERRFAAQLAGLMAKGVEESGGAIAGNRPVVFSVAGPRSVARSGTRRLIDADTRIAGWDGDGPARTGG